MIKSKTVFVVGAGASQEAGLPIGSNLTSLIAKHLDIKDDFRKDDPGFLDALRFACANGANMGSLVDAASRMRKAMPLAPSIDNYLDAHKADDATILLGKLAIARSILSAERSSPLFVDMENIYNIPAFSKLTATWYVKLWYNISTDIPVESIDEIFSNVSFIIFNYDRCVEQFLFEALKTYYQISVGEAAEVMGQLKIFHPYGQVGQLASMHNGCGVDFGLTARGKDLYDIAKEIKTFTERTEEGNELKAMKKDLAEANKIVYLGFAYHDINSELLKPGLEAKITRIFGTRYGMSDPDSIIVANQLKDMMMEWVPDPTDIKATYRNARLNEIVRPELFNGKCADLFSEYSKSIAS